FFSLELMKRGILPTRATRERQQDLFRSRLDQIIDMNHALVQLARAIDWRFLEERFGAVYSDKPGAAAADAGDGGVGAPMTFPTRLCAIVRSTSIDPTDVAAAVLGAAGAGVRRLVSLAGGFCGHRCTHALAEMKIRGTGASSVAPIFFS